MVTLACSLRCMRQYFSYISLVISHYVSQVQWSSGHYWFQPTPGKSSQTEAS